MRLFWIKAKLLQDNEEISDEERLKIQLPADLYRPSIGQASQTVSLGNASDLQMLSPVEQSTKMQHLLRQLCELRTS
jgi:hypothetical protein